MFRKLRGKLKELDIDWPYLAQELNTCTSTISSRMTAKSPWRLDEMYQILDLIHEPYEKLHEYFPKDGVTQGSVDRRKVGREG